jgi:hypothetical protein
MTWINFNWFKWNAEQQGNSLDKTVKGIYEVAYKQFEKSYTDDLKGADESGLEAQDRHNYKDFLHEEFRDQRAALALMTLSVLAKSLVLQLKQTAHGLNRNFPRQGDFKGKSELDRLAAEYQQRFGIVLDELAHFGTVREVVLARNSIFHGAGSPSGDYLEQTKARFLDEAMAINLTPELVDTIVTELKEFYVALAAALTDMYQAAAEATKAQSVTPAQ